MNDHNDHGPIGAPDTAFAPKGSEELLAWIHLILFRRTDVHDDEVQLAATMYVCLLETGFGEPAVTFCHRARMTYEALHSDGDTEAAIKACGDLQAFVSRKAIKGAAAVLSPRRDAPVIRGW